jgi:hypothetical protein
MKVTGSETFTPKTVGASSEAECVDVIGDLVAAVRASKQNSVKIAWSLGVGPAVLLSAIKDS